MKKIKAFGSLLIAMFGILVISGFLCIGAPSATPYIALGIFALAIFHKPKASKFVKNEFVQGICEKVQSSLIEILGKKAPSLKRTTVGYLQALKSEQNMSGVEVVPIDPGNGKKKTVRIKYIQRGTEQEIQTTGSITDCSTTVEREPLEEDVTLSNYVGTKGIKFTEDEMRKLCEPDSQWMAAIINSEIDPLVVKLNKLLIASQAANFGGWGAAGGSGVKNVKLLNATNDNAPVYSGMADIGEDFAANDISDRPILVGAGKLSKFVRQTKIGCCNTYGLNVAQMASEADFFYDRFVGPGLGDTDEFIALAPGYVQLLQWNKYVDTYAKENDVFSHGTIMDPWSGLILDMKWHYNDCNDTYALHFGTHWRHYFIPANAFNPQYDDLSGVNFSFNYKATT